MCLAVPGKIVSIEGNEPLELKGKIEFGGISKEVSWLIFQKQRSVIM